MAITEHIPEVDPKLKAALESAKTAKKDAPLTITVTLDPATYNHVCKEADEDDRTPAKWLARYIRESLGVR